MAQVPKAPRYRLLSLQVALTVWAVLVVARLFWIQVLDHQQLAERALDQQEETIIVPAQRGTIYDRNLTPLAMSLPVESLFAMVPQVAHPAGEAAALARVLDLDGKSASDLRRRISPPHHFAWVARQVTANDAAAVRALHLPGIYGQPATRRFYPKGRLAGSLLGFVGLDGHGLAGIEHAFDSTIAGQDGRAVLEVDAHRQSYSQVEQPPQEGANLVLTIDQNIQFIAQQELDRQVAATHALRGTVVIENPHTGEILALADSPSFNPDDYRNTPPSRLGDPAVTTPYEPGSVFKLVTISAALQQGLVTPEEMIDCQMGSIRLGGRIIHDHAAFGVISVSDILRHSSDVGAIKIGLKLGDDEFYHYIREYGFGQLTGVRLPGESRGLVRPPSRWQPMSIGAISMGQEVSATPLQLIAMVSTLANGGVYHAPRVVIDQFRGAGLADPPAFTAAPGRRVVSAVVANEMKQMMAQVVLAGTAQQAQLNGYTAGGKTGTAQKANPGEHGYSKTDYIASFVGFTPLNDPAIVVLVELDSPRGGHEGGAVAGPVFKRIAERVLPYLGVPHDVPVAAPTTAVRGASKKPAAAPAPVSATVSAPPLPVASRPAEPALAPGMVVIDYGSHGVTMPDFTGETVREVSAASAKLGLDLTLQGTGVARAQSPAAGARVAPGAAVAVRFTP